MNKNLVHLRDGRNESEKIFVNHLTLQESGKLMVF